MGSLYYAISLYWYAYHIVGKRLAGTVLLQQRRVQLPGRDWRIPRVDAETVAAARRGRGNSRL